MKSLAQVLGLVHQPVHQPQRRLTLAVVAPRVPALEAVYCWFGRWRIGETWERLNAALRERWRVRPGYDEHRLDVHGGHRHLRCSAVWPWGGAYVLVALFTRVRGNKCSANFALKRVLGCPRLRPAVVGL